MPTYLRKFYFKQLVDVKKDEKKQMDSANKKSSNINRPNISRFKR
jgi:hypothetical protein